MIRHGRAGYQSVSVQSDGIAKEVVISRVVGGQLDRFINVVPTAGGFYVYIDRTAVGSIVRVPQTAPPSEASSGSRRLPTAMVSPLMAAENPKLLFVSASVGCSWAVSVIVAQPGTRTDEHVDGSGGIVGSAERVHPHDHGVSVSSDRLTKTLVFTGVGSLQLRRLSGVDPTTVRFYE